MPVLDVSDEGVGGDIVPVDGNTVELKLKLTVSRKNHLILT